LATLVFFAQPARVSATPTAKKTTTRSKEGKIDAPFFRGLSFDYLKVPGSEEGLAAQGEGEMRIANRTLDGGVSLPDAGYRIQRQKAD
jgi:hypothetical protein